MSVSWISRRTLVVLCRWGVGLALPGTVWLTMVSAQVVPAPPRGEVLSPRIDTLSVPADRSTGIAFRGWVDFPHSRGNVVVEIVDDGNRDDATEEEVWKTAFILNSLSQTPTVVAGETRFYWNETHVASEVFTGRRWPDGGTARLRFRAVRANRQPVLLRVFDQNLVSGLGNLLVLADRLPTPVNPGRGHGTPEYLNAHGGDSILTRAETEKYYATVRKGPLDDGASIATLKTLDDFRKEYFTSASSCSTSSPEFQAKYFNDGDLGIGRWMRCIQNSCNQITACAGENFGTPSGQPAFDDFPAAKEALKVHKPFATVAMVSRGKMDKETPNKVFFMAYGADQKLLFEAQLDTKGFNKSIPTNCLVCHGSHSTYDKERGKALGAYFLPFDLDSFRFFDEGARDPLFPSRAEQEPQFKRLNQLVFATDLILNADARELILGWYGGTPTGNDPRNDRFPLATFQGQFVPSGWRHNFSDTQLYQQVIAKNCRTCHISNASIDAQSFGMATDLTFGAAAKLLRTTTTWIDVCGLNRMPNAEQTLKRFWQGGARPQLVNRLFFATDPNSSGRTFTQGCGVTALEPRGAGSAAQALDALHQFAADTCACVTPDCLTRVDARYLPEIDVVGSVAGHREEIASLVRKASTCRVNVMTAHAPGVATWPATAAALETERSQMMLLGR